MVQRGSGGFARGEGREGPGKDLQPWEVEWYQRSLWCVTRVTEFLGMTDVEYTVPN